MLVDQHARREAWCRQRHGCQVWKARNLRPWLVDTFKLSNDKHFEAKLVDVVGFYLDPPERAVVFSFDEKTQCQALDRTQPSLPMKPGRGRTMTHDYKRHGTIDLFAAHEPRDRRGAARHPPLTRRRRTCSRSSSWIDLHVPRHLDVHVVLDNLSAHKSETVRAWLADPKRARWHLHFTPTSASWLNLIEGWFSVLTRKALTNTSFTSTPPAPSSHRRVGITLERRPATVRVDQDRRRHHHQGQARTRHPRPPH